MRNEDREIRRNNNKKAYELICKADTTSLTAEEIEELKVLHTGYGGLGDNTQYFTPEEVVQYMISSLKITGFKGSKVLEPSCGNGIFISHLQKNFDSLDITAVELNYELFKLNKICYPEVNLINGNTLDYCEDFENQYDLVIGNPPYGRGTKRDTLKLSGAKLEGQFTELCLKALKPGGHFIMVLPTSVLSSNFYKPLRKKIINKFIILQSIELPIETFAKSDTRVSTSILHLRKKVVKRNIKCI